METKLIMDRFEECSPESQRMLIQSLIKEIRLFDGYVKIILSIGPTIKETLPEGLLDAKDPKEKRSTQKSEALTENTVGLRFRPNWLPGLVARRTSQLHIVHMVVRIYTRRSRKQLIRFGDPLPEKPQRAKRIIQNTIYEALKIQAFINNGHTRITWAKASKELQISDSKLAHLLKIVNTLPPDFVENMKSCADEGMLKIFNGRRLLKISRLKTEKERQAEIERLLPKT